MTHSHHHHYGHHHHHGHGHNHHHGEPSPAERKPLAIAARFGVAGIVVAAALLAACSVLVTAGDALVISRFGDPVRVLIEPGLSFKLPPPFETTLPVDLRLKTTSSGLQDVGTKDPPGSRSPASRIASRPSSASSSSTPMGSACSRSASSA